MSYESADLAILYQDHSTWLRNWLRCRTGCSQQAADLAQDTFVRVLLGRDLNLIREPRKYLATVANGLMIDSFRRQSVERAYREALAGRAEPLEISPETRAIILETLIAIDRMLDELGSRTRQIFLLAQYEGLTYAAIGERLGVSVTTVKKHLTRALTQCLLLHEN